MAERRRPGLDTLRRSVRRWTRRPTAPTSASPSGGPATEIVVDYRPDDDGDPDPGEVVWAWIPFEEDPTQGKDRPVIIIGRHGGRFAAVALSSRPPDGRDDRIAVGTGPWDRGRRDSFAKVDRIFGLRADQIRREGAALPRKRFDAVVAVLTRQPGWPRLDVDVVPAQPPSRR